MGMTLNRLGLASGNRPLKENTEIVSPATSEFTQSPANAPGDANLLGAAPRANHINRPGFHILDIAYS